MKITGFDEFMFLLNNSLSEDKISKIEKIKKLIESAVKKEGCAYIDELRQLAKKITEDESTAPEAVLEIWLVLGYLPQRVNFGN